MVKSSTLVENERDAPHPIARKKSLSLKARPLLALLILASSLSIASFVYLFANGMTNVYGDGVAHVNIARKVVDSPDDSLWRRYIQIGSPWLPLQTVLMLPLVADDWMWRTGVAGSAISMLSFVIATLFLYLLAKSLYKSETGQSGNALPFLSAAIFAFNPSVLYLQSTPMTELVFTATLLAGVYALHRWVNVPGANRLVIAGLAMAIATLTRYEAWPVAVLSIAIVAAASSGARARVKNVATYSGLIALGPAYWLWHNWMIYGNALEFLTGPNSARGIYLQNRANLGWSKIFVGNATMDISTMATATAVCVGPFILLMGGIGFLGWLLREHKSLLTNSPALLLLVPFFFHVVSLYRGEIQVFPLSAFGLHNVRYGLPHVLAVSLWAPAAILLLKGTMRRRAFIAGVIVIALQYAYLISEGPSQLAIYQEGYRNGVNARAVRDRAKVSAYVRANPPNRMILMNTGALGPVVSQGGLRFSNVIHEGSTRWHRLGNGIPADVSMVIVQQGDPLDIRVNSEAALSRDLASEFSEKLSVGGISVFERKSN